MSTNPEMTRRGAPLAPRQAEVLNAILDYYTFLHQACPVSYVAARLQIHHESARKHYAVLFRKGWLLGETSPATPRFIPTRRPATRAAREVRG